MALVEVTRQYYEGKKLKQSDLLCVLTSIADNSVSKVYRVLNSGEFEEQPRNHPKQHTYQIFRVPEAADMSLLLRKLEKQSKSYLVYGLPQRDIEPGKTFRRQKVNFIDRKTRWLIIDFDEILPPSWTPDTPPRDTFEQLWTSIGKAPGIPEDVPPSVWHLSNSWGDAAKECPKVHAFVRLDNPVEVQKLRAWAKQVKEDNKLDIDPAIYQRAQPIYTARPKLIGGMRADKLNKIQRIYTKKSGTPIISSDIILNIRGMRDAQVPTERAGDQELFDYVRGRLEDEGQIYQAREGNKFDVVCPLGSEHSGGSDNHTSSTIWAPDHGKGPSFHCQHANTHIGGRNGWQWYLNQLVKSKIISQARIHRIYQATAKSEFKLDEKHISNWSTDEIQSNYIYLQSTGDAYSVSAETLLNPATLSNLHRRVWASSEDKHSGIKPLKGMDALMVSNSHHEGCKVVVAERWDPRSSSLISITNGKTYLNSWRGFRLKPVAGNIKPFYRHIAFICPDPKEAEALADFLAHMIQCPWERPTWSPVHVSPTQGLGRGLLHTLIESITSPYSVTVTPQELFESPYNIYLKNTLWIGVEETETKSAKGANPRLKELVTARTANINPKYGKQLPSYPLYARLFFMTNAIDALPIEESDRRFWVIGPSEPGYRPKAGSYYEKFAVWIDQESNQSAILHDLLYRDISKFSFGHIPFKTKLKEQMREATRLPTEKALHFIRESNQFPDIAPSVVVVKWLEEWLDHHRQHASETEIKQVISTLPFLQKNKQFRIRKKMLRFRVLREHRNYKKAVVIRREWEEYLDHEDMLTWE